MPESTAAPEVPLDPPWKKRHTRQEAAWIVFRYEWDMYRFLWKYLSGEVYLAPMLHCAAVESLSLHTRNLCALLIGDDHLRNAVSISDMLPDADKPQFHDERLALMSVCGGYGRWWQEGKNAWILRVMSEPTEYRQESYNISPVLLEIDPPLRALCQALEAWKTAEEMKATITSLEGQSNLKHVSNLVPCPSPAADPEADPESPTPSDEPRS